MDKLITVFPLIFIVFLAGCASSTPSTTEKETVVATTGVEHEIEMNSNGFLPQQVNIKVGDTVVFVNKDVAPHWPASDIHPTHGVYPQRTGACPIIGGSDFDACKALSPGERYSFTFSHSGKWCFHDHLKPSLTGCVDVQ